MVKSFRGGSVWDTDWSGDGDGDLADGAGAERGERLGGTLEVEL
jgi:hypothetical protein